MTLWGQKVLLHVTLGRTGISERSGTLIQFKIRKEFAEILKKIPRPLDDSQPFFAEIVSDNLTSSVRKRFDKVEGYEWVTFRSFRDYGATLAHRQGVPPKVIQKMMGQKDVLSIQRGVSTAS
jgi:integrase